MIDVHRRLASLATLALLFISSPAIGATDTMFTDRPVVEVLRELRDPGLEFIYSSELLPPSIRVLAEPKASNRLMIAREILAAHGLSLAVVRPGLYAVVRARRPVMNGAVSGQVVDAHSDQPLANARLELLPIGAVQWSDELGRFSIGPVPEGTYTLRAEAAGFEPSERPELSVSAAEATAELRLVPAMTELAEVVVATSRYAFDRSGSFGSLLLEGETMAAQPSLGEDALQQLRGRLVVTALGAGQLCLRRH